MVLVDVYCFLFPFLFFVVVLLKSFSIEKKSTDVGQTWSVIASSPNVHFAPFRQCDESELTIKVLGSRCDVGFGLAGRRRAG